MQYTGRYFVAINAQIIKWIARVMCVFALGLTASTVAAEEIKIQYKGLTLNANFTRAAGKTFADDVILLTHGGLAHRDMEIISALRDLLNQKSYSTLAINLSLAQDNRHGMYDCQVTHRHSNDDAAEEIGVWVDWLRQQGAQQVTLLGHSRGGAQTALYAAERNNAPIKAIVLVAPALKENSDADDYARRVKKPLAPVLTKAQKLIKAGKGDTVLTHIGLLNCTDTTATANAFMSYYGPSPKLDTPSLMPMIHKPLLLLVAGKDEVVIGLDKKLAPLIDGVRVQMKMIDGADHNFRDIYSDEAVEEIGAFIRAVKN